MLIVIGLPSSETLVFWNKAHRFCEESSVGVCVGCVVYLALLRWDTISTLSFSLSLTVPRRELSVCARVCARELLKGDLLFLGHYQKRMDGF